MLFAVTKNEQQLSGEYRSLRQACLAAWDEADTSPGVYSVLDMPTGKRAALVVASPELRDIKVEPDYWPMYVREFKALRAVKTSPSHG
jgi:hypothetical protein